MLDPIIRTVLNAFLVLNAHDASIAEQWQAREPGVAPCPFTIAGGDAGAAGEQTQTVDGTVYCRWAATRALSQDHNGPFTITMGSADPYPSIEWVQASSAAPFALIRLDQPLFDPCNYDPADAVNVQDFMLFLNERPDFDGDGAYTAADYELFMRFCGG